MKITSKWHRDPLPHIRTVCRNCFKPRKEHVKNKCMFAPTDWAPMFRYEYQKWVEANSPLILGTTNIGTLSGVQFMKTPVGLVGLK